VLWFSLQYCSFWSTVHFSIVLVGLGRLASRIISVSAEWITCLCGPACASPVIGNSSLVNLNVLNYNGGDFPGIQRVFTCITCIWLLVHEPLLSIYQAYLTYYTSKKVQTTGVVTSTWRWHHETLSFPNQTCSMCLSIIYYINMFQVSVDFLSGLSSVQAFYSPQCTCHVYNWFRTTDAPIVRTSGNPEFRQNSAEFGSAENLQNSTEWVFSWQCSITYISFPSHAHGVYTIAPHLNMWNTPIVRLQEKPV